MRRGFWLALLAAALLGGWSYARLPYAVTHANWVFNVARNWQESGFRALGGDLVATPGGAGSGAAAMHYAGHRPAFMVSTRPAAWLLGDVHRGMILHSACLAALILAAAWRALGPAWGLWAAGAWLLSPGVTRLLVPEPIGTPMNWGAPLLLAVWAGLDRLPRTRAHRLLLLAGVPLWTQLNWTTAFLLAPFLLNLLLAAPAGQRTGRLAVCAWLAVALIPVGLASMQGKLGGAAGEGPRLMNFLGSYGFSAAGYGLGNPVSWPTALVRIGAALAVGLAPLWLVAGVRLWSLRRARAQVLPVLAAPATALLLVLLFRNYFAQHPWMACPILASALLLGLAARGPEPAPARVAPGWALAALILGLGVHTLGLQLFETQMGGMSRLARLLHGHTPRAATVWFAPDLAADPHFHHLEEASADFDRNVRAWAERTAADGPGFLLTRTSDDARAAHLVARTAAPAASALGRALAWYRTHLGRRRAGDAVELDAPCYLYRVP